MSVHFLPVAAVALFAAFTNEGCEFGSRSDDGRASFALIDGPAERVDLVKLTINRITLGYENGSVNLPIDPPVVIDNLLDFQGTNARQLLPLEEVRDGSYDWIRLYISERNDDSLVRERENGQEFPLQLEEDAVSGTETRYLQLNQSFRIPDDEDARFTLELDLRKALLKPESSYYLLRPTLRLARNEDSGTIRGTVAEALVTAGYCTSDNAADEGRSLGNNVYLYRGAGVNMGDIYTNRAGSPIGSRNPYATARVTQNTGNSEYSFEFGFIPAGSYTLGFTCQGMADEPMRQDSLRFDARQEIVVEAGEVLELDLL